MTINAKRLLKLADYLETVPRKNFDMGFFYSETPESPCGFAGCAMGWAAHGKLFRGLRWDWEARTIKYHDVSGGFSTAIEIFNLSEADAYFLFDEQHGGRNRNYDTPKIVANRIRKFVRENEKARA